MRISELGSYEVIGEVLNWARAAGRRFELFVEVSPGLPSAGPQQPVVLRLSGFNPAKTAHAHPAEYLSDDAEVESVVSWIRRQGYEL